MNKVTITRVQLKNRLGYSWLYKLTYEGFSWIYDYEGTPLNSIRRKAKEIAKVNQAEVTESF